MKALKITTKIIPFVAIITLNVFAFGSGFRMSLVQPVALIVAVVLITNLILVFSIKIKDHFLKINSSQLIYLIST